MDQPPWATNEEETYIPKKRQRDYLLLALNILIILLLIGSVGISVIGRPEMAFVMGPGIGLLALLAGHRRKKRR